MFRVFTILLLLPVLATAQRGNVLTATEQCWSGGIAGRHGCNYRFTLLFKSVKQQIFPDTLWIGNYAIKLTERNAASADGNLIITRSNKTVKFDITASTHYDDNALHTITPVSVARSVPAPPPQCAGVATLVYTYGNKRKYFVVPRIHHKYAPVAYP
jgi:hypothetical protein